MHNQSLYGICCLHGAQTACQLSFCGPSSACQCFLAAGRRHELGPVPRRSKTCFGTHAHNAAAHVKHCHLLKGRALYYDFVTYNYTTKAVPDVLVTVKSSGAVDQALYLYCNPAWFSATDGNSVPRPGNAIFSSGVFLIQTRNQNHQEQPCHVQQQQSMPVWAQVSLVSILSVQSPATYMLEGQSSATMRHARLSCVALVPGARHNNAFYEGHAGGRGQCPLLLCSQWYLPTRFSSSTRHQGACFCRPTDIRGACSARALDSRGMTRRGGGAARHSHL